MSNYTPGKWFASHREIPNDEDGMYATQVYTEDGETIATLAWYPMPKRKEIVDGESRIVTGTYRDGNAKLISAAPELLEALQKIIAITDRKHIAWDKAKAAIKKAIAP